MSEEMVKKLFLDTFDNASADNLLAFKHSNNFTEGGRFAKKRNYLLPPKSILSQQERDRVPVAEESFERLDKHVSKKWRANMTMIEFDCCEEINSYPDIEGVASWDCESVFYCLLGEYPGEK